MKIVYHSDSWFTRKYAKMLGEKMNLDVLDLNDLSKGNEDIIYFGNVFASSIKGLEKAQKKGNVVLIAAVGLKKNNKKTIAELKDINPIFNTPFFYLLGGFNIEALNGFNRLIIQAIIYFLGKKKNRSS